LCYQKADIKLNKRGKISLISQYLDSSRQYE